MATKSPIFPILEPQHFSDYGFDSQMNYFQEVRKQKKSRSMVMETLHFKLPKSAVSKDQEQQPSRKIKKNKKRWWKNALHFFTRNPTKAPPTDYHHGAHYGRSPTPVYITESRSGSTTPYRISSRPTSGPLAGTLTPIRKGEVEIPYFSLTELNMDHHHQRISASGMPIYLVT